MILPRLTVLEDRYAIGRVLDQERPFEVTYQAWNLMTEDQVVLKEFFPRTLAKREEGSTHLVAEDSDLFAFGLQEFLREARALGELDTATFVEEIEQLEANGTAYRVQEHHAGALLASVLKQQGGKLAPKTALSIIIPILEGLQRAHEQEILHAGITPSSIFVAKGGQPMLVDFQAAQSTLARKIEKTHLITQDGFSAPEQYLVEGPQGPWTDIYGIGATLYHAMTGQTLPAAYERLEDDPVPGLITSIEGLPEKLRDVLLHTLGMEPADRLQSVEVLHSELTEVAERDDARLSKPVARAAKAATGAAAAQSTSTAAATTKPAADKPAAKGKPEVKVAPTTEGKAGTKEVSGTKAKPAADKPAAKSKPSVAATPNADRPAAVRAAESKGEVKMPVLAAIAAVMLVAFVGGYFVMGSGDGDMARFSYYKNRGDSLYALANYAAAKSEYEQALTLREDQSLAQRLAETEERLEEQSSTEYLAQMQLGDDRLATADSLVQTGDPEEAVRFFAEANRAFMEAASFRPNDDVAREKAQQSAQRMNEAFTAAGSRDASEPDPEQIREQLYESYRGQGDALLRDGDLVAARRKFEEALEYRPGDRYASNQLSQIETQLSEEELEEEFQQLITRGTELCDSDRCAEAKTSFEQALQLKPGNPQALNGIARANQALAAVQQGEQRYQYFRGQGDTFLAQGNYDAAIASYENALEQKQGDAYVQQKINEARQALGAAQREQEQQQQQMVQDGVYLVAEEPPKLIGGLQALVSKARYPEVAYQSRVEGRVYVQFVVNERGRVQDAEVIRGVGAGCDEEALRVIREARFEPGRVSGEAVKARATLFIPFKLPADS